MGFEIFASEQNNQPSGFARFATPESTQKQYDKNIEQAGGTRNRRKEVDGVDPALANVDPSLYEDSDFDQFVNQANPEFVANHPTLSKVLAAPGYALQSIADELPQGLQDWANRVGQTGGEVMTMTDNPDKATTGNWLGDTTADLLGFGAGLIANPGGGAVSLGGGAMKAADYALLPASAKLAGLAEKGILGKGATRAIHGATAGAAYGGVEGLGDNEGLSGIAKTAGKEALTFGLAEPLLGGAGDLIGKGIKVVRGKLGKGATKVTDTASEAVNEVDDIIPEDPGMDFPDDLSNINLPFMPNGYKGDNRLLVSMQKEWNKSTPEPMPRPETLNRNIDTSSLPDQYPLPDMSNLEGKALANRAKNQQLALPGEQPLALTEGKTPNWEYGTGEINPEYQLQQLARQQKQAVTTEQGQLGKGARPNVTVQPSADPAYLNKIEGKYNQLINDEVARMKDELGGVVKYMPDEQNGPLLRASLNAKWYQDFWHNNGRSPREGEYRDMAIKNLIEGTDSELSGTLPASEEFNQILSELSRGQKLPNEWHGLQKTINEVAATDTAGQGEGLKSLANDMLAEQKRIEPYGLTKNLDRLTEIENKARQGMKDYMDYRKQYPDAVGVISKDAEFVKNAVILGSVKLARQGIKYAEWSKAMLAEIPTLSEKQLAYIWHRSQELLSKGTSVLKVSGNEVPVMLDENINKAAVSGLGKGAIPTATGELGKGATPEIPAGLKERGFSENTRTDINNPDALRDSYTENPLTYEQLGNKDTLAKAQAIFDQGYESARTQLGELASKMQPEAVPLAKLLSRQATEAGNIQGAREIISEVAEKLTQAGQFGQAAKILREADPETFLMTIGKQLKNLNKEGSETYGKKWKDFDLTPEELDMVSKIERGNQQSYEDAFTQIQSRIADEMPASGWEKINAWRHISMLLNPKTHIRNVGGNAIMMGMRKSAQRVSGVLQKVFLPEADRTQAITVNKEYKDLANKYFEDNKKDLLSGANKYQENVSINMPDKRVFRKSRIGEKLGKNIDWMENVRKFNYDLLQKGDNPFFQNAYVDRLASYAQVKGIKDFSKLGQEAFDVAKKEAEQATYKDASDIASFLNKVKHPGKGASLGKKTGAALTEAALPFTKTPINIIKRGIQYSPVGVINGLSKIKSSEGAATAIDEIAKGLTGTGILGLGYLLASKGILTGKASSDADLKAYDSNTGNSPFSILGQYSYDWMQPFSIPLSVGVEIYNAIKDSPEDKAKMDKIITENDSSRLREMALTSANGIMEGLNASGDTVFNLSIMKGIKTLLGSGTKGFMEGLAQLPQSYATQFIPTMFNQLAGTIDPLVRQSYVKGNMPESFKNAIVSRIPGASMSLQAKQTPFGEDTKKIENPIGRALAQFLSPGIVANNQDIDPKIDSELRRLNEFGLTKQFPTMVPNYIDKTQSHPRIELTPAETAQYQKRAGQLTLKSFNKIMNSGAYINAKENKSKNKSADEVKADLLANAIEEAKALAKKEIVQKKGYRAK